MTGTDFMLAMRFAGEVLRVSDFRARVPAVSGERPLTVTPVMHHPHHVRPRAGRPVNTGGDRAAAAIAVAVGAPRPVLLTGIPADPGPGVTARSSATVPDAGFVWQAASA
ncbi:hypothetical protein [Kitasatospora sp. NPDC057223]|uniref:hypothetical protein n=1 Tax=Kitasatospora sp. NPDC057223 TaxID=3346055 RepID=UPI003642FC7C